MTKKVGKRRKRFIDEAGDTEDPGGCWQVREEEIEERKKKFQFRPGIDEDTAQNPFRSPVIILELLRIREVNHVERLGKVCVLFL